MDMRNLFTLRFKRGTQAVQMAYVTASNLAKAGQVGRWYCGQNPNMRFVSVEPAVVADETDLQFSSVDDRDDALKGEVADPTRADSSLKLPADMEPKDQTPDPKDEEPNKPKKSK